MKKYLLLSFAVAMGLGSCTVDKVTEVQGPKKINLGTFVYNIPSKGAIQEIDELKTEDLGGFYVYAYNSGDSVWSARKEATQLIVGSHVNWVSEKWDYSPIAFWPQNSNNAYSKVSFFAFSKIGAGNSSSAIEYDNLKYTAPSLNDHADTAKFIFTTPDSVVKHVDLLVGEIIEAGADKVNFEFKHALSKISFFAKTKSSYRDNIIIITDAKITIVEDKINRKGTYTYGDTPPMLVVDGTSDFLKEEVDIRVVGTDTLSDTKKDITDTNKYLMIVPQKIEGGDITISLTYTVQPSPNPNHIPAITYTITDHSLPEISGTTLSGKDYHYVLSISLAPIEFDAGITVENWEYKADTTDIPPIPPIPIPSIP